MIAASEISVPARCRLDFAPQIVSHLDDQARSNLAMLQFAAAVGLRTHRRFGGRVSRTIKVQGWLAPRPPFDMGSSENATRRRNSKIAAARGPHRAQRPQLLANAPYPAIRRRIFLKDESRLCGTTGAHINGSMNSALIVAPGSTLIKARPSHNVLT
jgi:hypothetical protein